MAEILISLTIIGVIAAIIIPSLQANIDKKVRATKHKAFYSRLSQALAMIDKDLNKYGQYNATYDSETSSLNVTTDTAAMTFVTEALGQVLTFNNICDSNNLKKCGVAENVTNLDNSKIAFPKTFAELFPNISTSYNGYSPVNTSAVAFETKNGESVVVYLNPLCKKYTSTTKGDYLMQRVCVNLVYDINGLKGPNTMYKDIYALTMLSPENPNIVSPVFVQGYNIAPNRNIYICNTLENARLANVDELTYFLVNRKLLKPSLTGYDWWYPAEFLTSAKVVVNKSNFYVSSLSAFINDSVLCVKKK